MRWARFFLPLFMMTFTRWATSGLLYRMSGTTWRFSALWRRDMVGNPLGLLRFFRALDAVLGAAAAAFLDARRIQSPAHDVVAHAGQILNAASAHEHDRVLLQVVALVGDVGDDLVAVREPDLRDLADGRVRLLRGARHYLHADAPAEGVALQGGGLRLDAHLAAALAYKLVDGWHSLRLRVGNREEKRLKLLCAKMSARTFWRKEIGIAEAA